MPCMTLSTLSALGTASPDGSPRTQRVGGTLVTASPAACWSDQQVASVLHPPGQEPQTLVSLNGAAASSILVVAMAVRDAALESPMPPMLSRRWFAIARGVGCSKTSVDESVAPLASRSLDESSVAASESRPASISGVSGSCSVETDPVNSRTVLITISSIFLTRSWADSGANMAANGADASSDCFPSACAFWPFLMATSSKYRSDASGRASVKACPSAGRGHTCRRDSPSGESAELRQTVYSSREIAAMPLKFFAAPPTLAAPMPAPSTRGH
eukprot:2908669-Prymnesium_polylepis.1